MTTPTGWLCPSCGKAHGPHVDTCPGPLTALASFSGAMSRDDVERLKRDFAAEGRAPTRIVEIKEADRGNRARWREHCKVAYGLFFPPSLPRWMRRA